MKKIKVTLIDKELVDKATKNVKPFKIEYVEDDNLAYIKCIRAQKHMPSYYAKYIFINGVIMTGKYHQSKGNHLGVSEQDIYLARTKFLEFKNYVESSEHYDEFLTYMWGKAKVKHIEELKKLEEYESKYSFFVRWFTLKKVPFYSEPRKVKYPNVLSYETMSDLIKIRCMPYKNDREYWILDVFGKRNLNLNSKVPNIITIGGIRQFFKLYVAWYNAKHNKEISLERINLSNMRRKEKYLEDNKEKIASKIELRSDRRKKIIDALVKGMSIRQISLYLQISYGTVRRDILQIKAGV